MFSPEHRVFGYSADSPLSEDEENEVVFSPFTFIKNIPNRSQQSRPVSAVRDIPPKTRSMPAATLVLDLDETLVFSSLNVIHDAEYTFNTHFQDNKYKVGTILTVRLVYGAYFSTNSDETFSMEESVLWIEDSYFIARMFRS